MYFVIKKENTGLGLHFIIFEKCALRIPKKLSTV